MEEQEILMETAPVEEAAVEAKAVEMPLRKLQDDDAMAFVREYPGLDPRSIPKSVWEAVQKGDTLMGAYGRHELKRLREDNRRLQQELDVFHQNAANRERSLGSMRSSGKAQVVDDFLMGFDQD